MSHSESTNEATIDPTAEEQIPEENSSLTKEEVLAMMKRLWSQTKAHNAPHMTRDELHERR